MRRDCLSKKTKPPRLAMEGEELVAHRFRSAMVRMVSHADYCRWRTVAGAPGAKSIFRKFLTSFLRFIAPGLVSSQPGPVVAFPSEALLRVYGIAPKLQGLYHLSAMEDAISIEVTPWLGRRTDALCFGNGVILPLESLDEGQRVRVLYSTWTQSLEPISVPLQLEM